MTQIELHVEDTRGSRRPLPIVHEDSFDEYSRDEINNASTPKELRDKIARGGMLRVHIDPFNYDVAPEADEEMRFHWGPWIEDCFTQTFWPVSLAYVYTRYGYEGLQIQALAPPTPPKDDALDLKHHDPEAPHTVPSLVFFYLATAVFVMKFVLLYCFFAGGYHEMRDDDARSWAPVYAFGLAMFANFTTTMVMANKKALRKRASLPRLISYRERRNEELLFGWLPFPWWVAVFELRVAAFQVGLDLNRRFTFPASPDELSDALGERVVALLERDGEPVVRARDGGGSSCTALALLLRAALGVSYAHPAFGPDAKEPYLNAHMRGDYVLWVAFVGALPYIIAHGLQGGGRYDVYGVLVCVIAFIYFIQYAGLTPQGFFYGAIISVQRRAQLLTFLNRVLLAPRDASDPNAWSQCLDLTDAPNFDLWYQCRHATLRFGEVYKKRTDTNGGVLLCYLAVMTLTLVLGSALRGDDPVPFRTYAFPIVAHFFIVVMLGLYGIALAMHGESCTDVADESKCVLAQAMLHLEARGHEARDRDALFSARFATQQLHEALVASRQLDQAEVLSIIELNKALVFTVFVSCLTQVTLVLDNTTLGGTESAYAE